MARHDVAAEVADEVIEGVIAEVADEIGELAGLLRQLRRRHARRRCDSELTYRELAARTGWSHTAIAEYFTGKTLPPTDRLDALLGVLGVSKAEQRSLATARDRIEEGRRHGRAVGLLAATGGIGLSASASAGSPTRVTPRHLPASPARFVGRAAQLRVLSELIELPVAETVGISVVTGMAGVGKTALALYWAHQVRESFPDGQLYIDLRGFHPTCSPVDPSAALRRLLEALQLPARQIPAELEGRVALYRSLLSGRRMLLLLDNARDGAQIRPILPATPGCLVVVTSRSQLTGLVAAEGAQLITVDPFTFGEARELLIRRLGAQRVEAEHRPTNEIIDACAGLPLALSVVAARAVAGCGLPLDTLAMELNQYRLDALGTGDCAADVRAAFSWSYQALTTPAARLFRVLGLHPGPHLSAAAVAAAADLPASEVRLLLAELGRANLLLEPTPGRYALHELLRVYAAEQATEQTVTGT